MHNLRTAVAALTALLLTTLAAVASQGSGCLPTTGTVSGLTMTQNINAAIAAVISSNSGATAPATDCTAAPVAGQLWLDTTAPTLPILKIYSGTDWLRLGTVDVATGIWAPPVGGGTGTIVSATSTDLCTSLPQSVVTVTGTTTIAGFGSACVAGTSKDLKFESAGLVLTYNATSLILPTSASITTQAGDYARAVALGGSNWAIVGYSRADGTALSTNSVFAGAVFFNSPITPTTLAANTDDWNPTNLTTANVIRVQASSAVNLTGIVAPLVDGKRLILRNVGSFTITLLPEATSTAANRFAIPRPFTLVAGDTVELVYDITLARWKQVTQVPVTPAATAFKNLRVFNVTSGLGDVAPTTPNREMSVAADSLTLVDSLGHTMTVGAVACTSNLNTSGANGLDTGSLAADTWYAVWVVYNPATNTASCLFSLNAQASSITLPSGYTFAARVGMNRTDASSNLYRILQIGRQARYTVRSGTNTAALRQITTGTGGVDDGTSPTWAQRGLQNYIPSTSPVRVASRAFMVATTRSTSVGDVFYAAPSANYAGINSTNPPLTYVKFGVTGVGSVLFDIVLETSTVQIVSTTSDFALLAYGWEDNL